VFDHFATVFEFPGGVKVFSFCRQVAGATNDVNDHVIATAGSAQIQKHTVEATNKDKWTYRGDAPNMYDQEHRELFAAIRNVKTINQGEQMAHSTMIGILGRMAGYTGKRVTWDQAFGSEENLMPPNLDMKAAMPVAPVPKPGRTTLR
jgi:hypothetical protein